MKKKKFTREDLQKIVAFARILLPRFCEEHGEALEGKNYGYMFIRSHNGRLCLGSEIGPLPGKEYLAESKAAQEQLNRLVDRRTAAHHDLTNLPEQTYKERKFAGAVWISLGLYISFSGFTSRYNILFCIAVLKKFDYINEAKIEEVMKELDAYEQTGK